MFRDRLLAPLLEVLAVELELVHLPPVVAVVGVAVDQGGRQVAHPPWMAAGEDNRVEWERQWHVF